MTFTFLFGSRLQNLEMSVLKVGGTNFSSGTTSINFGVTLGGNGFCWNRDCCIDTEAGGLVEDEAMEGAAEV